MGNNATKFNLTDYLLATLAVQAHQIADAGHNGWGNTMTSAADEITRLCAEVERLTALIARIEQCLPATDAGLQCPTCGSREHLDKADICDRCDMAAIDVVRRRMTVEQFIAHVGRVDALIGGR